MRRCALRRLQTAHLTKIGFFFGPMPMPMPTEYLHRYACHLRPGTRRGLVDAPCDLGRSASLNLRSFQQLLRCPPANPSLAHSLTSPFEAELPALRSCAWCCLPACHERTGVTKQIPRRRPISAPRHFNDTPPCLPSSHLSGQSPSHRLPWFTNAAVSWTNHEGFPHGIRVLAVCFNPPTAVQSLFLTAKRRN
ncbi:hypothetical protein CTAM01_09169 [Colletotrichum tamarilloi]|uniref:Uncharacterized protein n=1 Tax=Colletotrichum tamarilloi TaxID=1209934 RepID=A0ABQ9R3U8_9PEZI|nr:uncharacterized protein CTAM01_09169 [Colletotrichum tamarilloi]KAK1493978.1 hypothetical protein CTAM01_09169 [Colletotrichum tamarilloi]